MLTFTQNVLLFLPLFLIINIVAAVPGRMDLKAAIRVGLRHFVMGTLLLTVISVILYFLMGWLITRPPLW